MIAFSEAGETRVVGGKCKTYKNPQIDGVRYAVVQCGTFFQVRCRRYAKGFLKSDQLVSGELTERNADDLARFLATKGEDEQCPTSDLYLTD